MRSWRSRVGRTPERFEHGADHGRADRAGVGCGLLVDQQVRVAAACANWKPAAGPAEGCAPSQASTGTPSRRNSWSIHRPRTSAGRGWITSRTASTWTRSKLGAVLVAAGLGPAAEHALSG
jgi:hypothetical protein